MADLVRVGDKWVPTDLRTAENKVDYFSTEIDHFTRLLNNANTTYGRETYQARLAELAPQLAYWQNQQSIIENYFKSPTGQADAQANFSRISGITSGTLKLPSPNVENNSTTVTPFAPATGMILGGGIGILVLLVVVFLILRRRN